MVSQDPACLLLQVVSAATHKGQSGQAFTAYAIKVTGHDGACWQVLRRFRCALSSAQAPVEASVVQSCYVC